MRHQAQPAESTGRSRRDEFHRRTHHNKPEFAKLPECLNKFPLTRVWTVILGPPLRMVSHRPLLRRIRSRARAEHLAGRSRQQLDHRNSRPPLAPTSAATTAPASSNGVYAYGVNSVFSTITYTSATYWVDVVYTKTPPSTNPLIEFSEIAL